MMKKHLILFHALLAYSTISLSSPASTDYVNARIKEAVDALQLKITQEHKSTESKINTIPIVTLHKVGELYQGGLIFWVDETKQHGLVVAKIDANLGAGTQWQNGLSGEKITNARGDGLYAGASNTQLIIAEQTIDDQEGEFAALSARNVAVLADGLTPCTDDAVCYGNWYLPSLTELRLLRTALYTKGLGDFSGSLYWSSTEHSVNQAHALTMSTGESVLTDKSSTEPKVRAIHSF